MKGSFNLLLIFFLASHLTVDYKKEMVLRNRHVSIFNTYMAALALNKVQIGIKY